MLIDANHWPDMRSRTDFSERFFRTVPTNGDWSSTKT